MDSKRVDKLVKEATATHDGEDMVGDDEECEETKMDRLEMKELEKIIEDKHANYAKISRHYKLFEYVARAQPEQILRYAKPRSSKCEPLWMSERFEKEVPPCPRCGGKRLFEVQVMPQIFDQLKELLLVDWNTIAVYTCSSRKCYPDMAKGEHYIQEYSYIQLSEDFSRVRYGEGKQK